MTPSTRQNNITQNAIHGGQFFILLNVSGAARFWRRPTCWSDGNSLPRASAWKAWKRAHMPLDLISHDSKCNSSNVSKQPSKANEAIKHPPSSLKALALKSNTFSFTWPFTKPSSSNSMLFGISRLARKSSFVRFGAHFLLKPSLRNLMPCLPTVSYTHLRAHET